MTSHDVVDQLRRRLRTKRVGHSGTLDPLAHGLLVAAVGPATRFLQYLPLEPKTYVATIVFGKATDSYDREGAVTSESAIPGDLAQRLPSEIQKFRGLITQMPPMYSAIKVNGKPLYAYARAGEEATRKSRTVHIDQFTIDSFDGETLTSTITCSGGTYIRSLAHDLGQVLGCGAFLGGLSRNSVGRFSIEQSIPPMDFDASHLISLAEALDPMPKVVLNSNEIANIQFGRAIISPVLSEGQVCEMVTLISESSKVVGIARLEGQYLHPEVVIPKEVFADV